MTQNVSILVAVTETEQGIIITDRAVILMQTGWGEAVLLSISLYCRQKPTCTMSIMYQALLLILRSSNANLQLEFDLYYMYV